MNKTNIVESDKKITVDIVGLQGMLSCGKNTALAVGKQAGAVIKIGKRTLYNVKKVEEYMNSLSEV